ncbi:S8 family serine peptidase [Luedemannella helvata]|uniref:Type VII secretion-associated serine protease mycosin n=1 Tax=Luedemannella helvata TaxID=349315 RepID=A0ABP4VY02_9ACTN
MLAAGLALGVAAATGVAAAPAHAAPAHAAAVRADQARDGQWYLKPLQVSEVHKVTQGEGITVAVIDSGVNANHPDLAGNVLPGHDMADPDSPDKGRRDRHGHGTGIATLIAGHGHGPGGSQGILGIAPRAKILPINVWSAKQKSSLKGAVGPAIRWAVDNGADVINVSLAGGWEADDLPAIRYALQAGVLVVAGVGNSPSVLVQAPANVGLTIAVTGHDKAGKPVTSVRGTPVGDEGDFGIDIAAPGKDIMVPDPDGGYDKATGTSTSTAIVSGALALVRAAHPNAGPGDQIKQLTWTGDDIGPKGPDDTFGLGRLNLMRAVTGQPHDYAASAPPTPTRKPATGTERAALEMDAEYRMIEAILIAVISLFCLSSVALVAFLVMRRRRRRAARAAEDGDAPDGP